MTENTQITIHTSLGTIIGNITEGCREFLGIPYAKAERFAYCEPVEHLEEPFHAVSFGNICPSFRQYFPNLENPERLFYYREFREGQEFSYDEDCLNLNIYTPLEGTDHPVAVFIHGGGFNSGSNNEEPFRGYELAKRGIITVCINYRVGVLGYLTHADIQKKYGRDGNFGLDDQLTAIRWVKKHIRDFGGNPGNMTLFGQSAGAISIQYLCLNHHNTGLFKRVLMMSGGGMFPEFALPKASQDTREYWLQLMEKARCGTLEELKNLDIAKLLEAAETLKHERKDTTYCTMPVVDGYLIEKPVPELIGEPLPVGYMLGYTNNDMYAPMLAYIANRFGKENHAYVYFFDLDAPGDNNGAFHSSDLRYIFGRLDQSWRPYTERDHEASRQMMDYFAAYAETGNPNGQGRPVWQRCQNGRLKVLAIGPEKTCMGRASMAKLGMNMIRKGNPKA